jgi:hypothetical protein
MLRMGFAVVSAVVILVLGTVIALAWWRIAAKMAPYEDEVRPGGDGDGPGPEVIRGFDSEGAGR